MSDKTKVQYNTIHNYSKWSVDEYFNEIFISNNDLNNWQSE